MSEGTGKFEHLGDEHQARKEDARLNAEIDEWDRQEKQKIVEVQQHIGEIEELLSAVAELMEIYAVGKHPGTSVAMGSPIEDLRIAAEKEERLAQGRGGADVARMNRFTNTLSLLKDETVVRPETSTVGELLKTTNGQLEKAKDLLRQLQKQPE